MKLDISDVISCENKEVAKEVPIETESFVSKLGRFPITGKAPVKLTIANRENRHLLVSGEGDVQISIPCSRCLEEVLTDIHFVIEKKIPLGGAGSDEEEMEDSDCLTGFHLDTDRLIYGEILVNWPMKVLCKEDCRGICKVCGRNLNKGECGCQRTELDPRMAAIQDVFNKFKEV